MSLILNILEYYQDIIIVHQVGDAESSLTKKLLTSVLSDDLLQQLRIAMRLDLVHLGLFSNYTFCIYVKICEFDSKIFQKFMTVLLN